MRETRRMKCPYHSPIPPIKKPGNCPFPGHDPLFPARPGRQSSRGNGHDEAHAHPNAHAHAEAVIPAKSLHRRSPFAYLHGRLICLYTMFSRLSREKCKNATEKAARVFGLLLFLFTKKHEILYLVLINSTHSGPDFRRKYTKECLSWLRKDATS